MTFASKPESFGRSVEIFEIMKETVRKLKNALIPLYGERESDAVIRLIFHHLKGWELTDMLIHRDEELSDFVKKEIDVILKRLLNYEPIQYITGEARFHGLEFKVAPGVLIPRPETEELVDMIIRDADDREDLKVLDIGTGSGCIAVTLARFLKFPIVTAIDNSEKALAIAEENAKRLKAKVKFLKEDIFAWTPKEKYDIIVSNPPYVTESEKMEMEWKVLDYEPETALFVPDENPLVYYTRIIELASNTLINKGKLYFEINPNFADRIKELMENKGFSNVEIIRDSFGKQRFVVGIRFDTF